MFIKIYSVFFCDVVRHNPADSNIMAELSPPLGEEPHPKNLLGAIRKLVRESHQEDASKGVAEGHW